MHSPGYDNMKSEIYFQRKAQAGVNPGKPYIEQNKQRYCARVQYRGQQPAYVHFEFRPQTEFQIINLLDGVDTDHGKENTQKQIQTDGVRIVYKKSDDIVVADKVYSEKPNGNREEYKTYRR